MMEDKEIKFTLKDSIKNKNILEVLNKYIVFINLKVIYV